MDQNQLTAEADQVCLAEWSSALETFEDANLYQTWPYGSVRWGESNLSHLVLRRGGVIVAMAQLRIMRPAGLPFGIAYLRWGPICHSRGKELDGEIFGRMAKALHEEYVLKRGLFLRVLPNAVAGSERAQWFQTHFACFRAEPFKAGDTYRTLILDLTLPLAELRKRLDQKWRNQLNRAERNGLEISEGSSTEDFRTMAEVFDEMWQRKRFRQSSSIDEFSQIQERLPSNQQMKVLICRSAGVPVSAMIGTAMGNSGIYLFGATNDKGLSQKGSYLLQWRMIEWLKEKGVQFYNLGGINPETNPGVYHFKKGMSGSDVRYVEPLVACDNLLSSAAIRVATLAKSHVLPGVRKMARVLPAFPAHSRAVST